MLGKNICNVAHNASPVKDRFRQILVMLNADIGGRDIDHIHDRGFGGSDTLDNLWPLAEGINRRPFKSWRTLYRFNIKGTNLFSHTLTLTSYPINGFGTGKYYRISGVENRDIPNESETENAGSDLHWGKAESNISLFSTSHTFDEA